MRVLSVTSEIFPLVKTGGLADVAGALPAALAAEHVEVRSLVPGYPAVLAAMQGAEPALALPDLFGGPARVLAGTVSGLALFCLDAPHLYDRPGSPYGRPDGADWGDNLQRFAALSQVGAALGRGAVGWAPDVVQAHDWQAGLVPAYLHFGAGHFSGGARPATVMTVHNLAFQGRYPAYQFGLLGLPPEAWSIDGVEFYGGIGTLKAGLRLADRITTVSPTYAAEIAAPGGGMGLDGLLQTRHAALSGILNGIDTHLWNPATDAHVAAQYGVHRLRRRLRNKAALQAQAGLAANPGTLLFGAVSRLPDQRGMGLRLAARPDQVGQALIEADGRPALAGEGLAHLIQAGCDALLVPSRFEPCGLTQLCALRYGALPVVARVGGLADTVIDANPAAVASGVATGVVFAPVTQAALEAAIARTADLWRHPAAWAQTQRNAMRAEVGWTGPARAYAALFREAVQARG